jgi:putative addiction module component (TIGR02574 family)
MPGRERATQSFLAGNHRPPIVTTMSTVQEIEQAAMKLPKHQRLQLAEGIWFSVMDDATSVPSGHKKILDERWSAYRNGKAKRISRRELERRLGRK